jgi:collagen type IX alpha
VGGEHATYREFARCASDLQIFDKEWHKIHFGVFRDRVELYVDCERNQEHSLQPRGPIDVNGVIEVSKTANGRRTVPVS